MCGSFLEERDIDIKVSQQDEVGANLERVAESCIANLDVEVTVYYIW